MPGISVSDWIISVEVNEDFKFWEENSNSGCHFHPIKAEEMRGLMVAFLKLYE